MSRDVGQLARPREAMKRVGAVFALALTMAAAQAVPEVGKMEINGAIGPATAEYLQRAIQVAASRDEVCLIVQLNTLGGLLTSTRDMVQTLYASPVPVVVYVAPSGATATSAGCIITLAADLAAMAPATSIGAAHPVEIGGGGESTTDPVMKEKLANYTASYAESIATHSHHNAEWAKSSVHESVATTSERALELKVIDLIAKDIPDLLKQLEGREWNGHKLHTATAQVREIPMLFHESIFQALWGPEVMFVLMLIAMYGIIGELSNPGVILPGVVGAIALILALYMGSVLPVNAAAAALILLAAVLWVVDIYAPTHGVLTVGGAIAFFMGSIMLFNTGNPAYHLSLAWVLPGTLLTVGFFLLVVGAGLRAQKRPTKTGKESLLGKTAPALTLVNRDSGKVFMEGAYWNAHSETPIPQGQLALVVGVKGLTLQMKPAIS